MIPNDELDSRHGFLAALHRLLDPRVYLEVGVQHGTSLRLAQRAQVAIGIDPSPQVGPAEGNQVIYRVTSDEFFNNTGIQKPSDLRVDLAFVDGMHHAEYALRDLLNIERYCHQGSLVVLDDVLPRNTHEARRVAPDEEIVGDWTGDVWKVYYALREVRPDLRLTLVDTDPTGVLLVQFADERPVFTPDYGISLPDEVPDEVLSRALAVSAEEALAAVAP